MENPTVPAKPAEVDNSPAALAPPQTSWERSVLETLAMETLAEQKRTRRWRTTVSLLWLSFFVLILLLVLGATAGKQAASGLEKHTALVDLKGVIAAESKASADKIISALQSAFKDKNTQGVVLRIDSPGGSPVQSGYINDEIKPFAHRVVITSLWRRTRFL